MNQKEYRSKKWRRISSIEPLDDRTLLSGVAAIPPTPAPAPSPVDVPRLERRIERMDRVFMTDAKHVNKVIMARSAQMEAVLQTTVSRAQAEVQAALQNAATTPASMMVAQDQAASSQVAALVATTASSGIEFGWPSGSTLRLVLKPQ